MVNDLIPIQVIESKIFIIRGLKVMLDSDLSQLYGVESKRLNEAVKRNLKRFPQEFMFQLTNEEWTTLRSQFATSKEGKGGRRYLPYVFTEHGTLMLSNVLNSDRAINVSIQIIKVFDKLKQYALSQNELAGRIDFLEQAFMNYSKNNNADIDELQKAVNYLLDITKPTRIGFVKVE